MDRRSEEAHAEGPLPVADGEFAGWRAWRTDAFENLTGPFVFRVEDDGSVRCAFRATRRHMNGSGALHGGCMMTFADFCLFAIAYPLRDGETPQAPMVTISLNADFVGPAYEGDLIEGRGEVVRAGGSLIFVRGLIETSGRPMMTFSGVIKKVRPKIL
jgi:uncharacterized protein (TIGR00369 family)